jgi:hypothetical protein
MEASGDKAMEGGGEAGTAAALSAGACGNSVGAEHDANRKPSATGVRRRDFTEWFI